MNAELLETAEGFTQLHPQVVYETECSYCAGKAAATDWLIPGLWTMATLLCSNCGKSYLSDLPYGVGAVSPVSIDITNGAGLGGHGGTWYLNLTGSAWRNRQQ